MGVTGNGANFHKDIHNYLSEVKKYSDIPVMMGFGIRTAQDVLPLKDVIDGAIVGSHFIRLMKESEYSEQVVTDYIVNFQKELNQ
jgi:tryptophan synthase alpha chain